MDPVSLAAVGLAGNVVQFVDFGCKLLRKTSDIYKDGFVVEHKHLEVVTGDLSLHAKHLRDGLSAQRSLDEDEAALRDICGGCLYIASQLETALQKLQRHGAATKWKSFRQALKSIWGKDQLNELKSQLELYSQQMDRRTLVTIMARVDKAALRQAEHGKEVNDGIAAALQRLEAIEESAQLNGHARTEAEQTIVTAVGESTVEGLREHIKTQSLVAETSMKREENSAKGHLQTQKDVARVETSVNGSIAEASEENRQLHNVTQSEIERIREATQKQVDSLQEEIRLLKIEIQECVKKVVASVGKVSAREEQRLKETSNAKFNLWVAKEVILKKLLEILGMFKSQIGDWVQAFEASSWKIAAYPKPKKPAHVELTPVVSLDLGLRPAIHLSEPQSIALSQLPADKADEFSEELYEAMFNTDLSKTEALLRGRDINSPIRVHDTIREVALDMAISTTWNARPAGSVIQLLLDLGATPTVLSLNHAILTRDEFCIKQIGNAFILAAASDIRPISTFSNQHEALEEIIRSEPDLTGTGVDVHVWNEGARAMLSLLRQNPALLKAPHRAPLTFAAINNKRISAVLLLLLGASPTAPGRSLGSVGTPILGTPITRAIEHGNIGMACLLVRATRSSIERGWEWMALEALARSNFRAPGHEIDKLIDLIGIPLGLQLAIEHRHERLISHMLWHFKMRCTARSDQADQALDQAWELGLERGFVEVIRETYSKKRSSKSISGKATGDTPQSDMPMHASLSVQSAKRHGLDELVWETEPTSSPVSS